MNDDTFIKFGEYKVIIVSAIVENQEFNFHHNVLLKNNTTFAQYYEQVEHINKLYSDDRYEIDVVEDFKVTVWNMDNIANKNIKITSSTIKNYKPGFQHKKTKSNSSIRQYHTSVNKTLSQTHFTPIKNIIPITANPFATMDIETMKYNNTQIPVAITFYLPGGISKLFLLNNSISVENL
jgi:hypothetical protein